jgi:hypothetical protein
MLRVQTEAASAAADSPRTHERLKLYKAVLRVMEGDTGDSDQELKKVVASQLIGEELTILKAAIGVDAKFEGEKEAPAQNVPDEDAESDMPLVQTLRQSLADSEKLLQRAQQR